ncbi:S41 family peptidase [Longirhabdus pacifica]|uniref:S41 family peptidase n=1 Tax=Longirhabdus pacifica TaxID=2305227 RepID=UPI001008E384|nr:S41 family peptidase [Longirhabdus pacifica]
MTYDFYAAYQKIVKLLEQNYVIQSKKESLLHGMKEVDEARFDDVKSEGEFIQMVNALLIQHSNDKHLYVESIQHHKDSQQKESEDSIAESWLKKELEQEQRYNYGFTEAKIMPNNIGYLKLKSFANPDRGIDTAIAAMKMIENDTATMIDLRDNGGGYGGMAEYILSYFFDDEPTLLSTTYFADEEIKHFQTFTTPFVVGKRKLNHPLYILINPKTGSAAEFFAYVLQAHQKATIVGETSNGAANRNTYFSVSEQLRISISTGEPIIEATGSNWEGKGVIPDIHCEENEALQVAIDNIEMKT